MAKRKLTQAERDRLNAKHVRKPITLAGGATAANPGKGRDRRSPPADDARTVSLEARLAVFGLSPVAMARLGALGIKVDVDAVMANLRSPLAGDPMGRCIMTLHTSPNDRASLWDVWQALCASRANYRTRILGSTGQPQGAAIAMVPDRMQTDSGLTVDMRSPDERDAAAKRAEVYWSGLIAALPTPQHKWALGPAMDEVEGALWVDCAPTTRGRVAVAALGLLAAMHARA